MRALPLFLCLASTALALPRLVINFDKDWEFSHDDQHWRSVNLPHDWSIEGPFDKHNPTGGAGAFLPAGIGLYRKHFDAPAAWRDRRVFIEFEGVMANSDVWINGALLGHRPYGYVSFEYELTPYPKFGADNEIRVRADNSHQPASRWYAGAGIYRHVWLVALDPVHIEPWSTFVSTPKAAKDAASVHVQTSVVNQSARARSLGVQFMIVNPDGKSIGTKRTGVVTVEPGKAAKFDQDFDIESPDRWDLDHPARYRVLPAVFEEETALDTEAVLFGIRDIHFEPATGFWINGRNIKLKGVCLHQEAGALGTAVPNRAWERRIEALKEIGVNAIRTAHNPPSPDFLSICDRMGVLVMDELFDSWTGAKNPYDYHLYFRDWSKIDVRDTVMRDRNHPSVIIYSAGNEIRDTPQAEKAKQILRDLVDTFHEFDPTRPVTQALFRPNLSHDYEDGLADILEVIGQNYREDEILKAHADKPTRKILGTENGHDRKVWLALRDNPPYAGQFLWTGIDYLGESRRWPLIGAVSGLLDRTGALKPAGMERASWWSDKPVVHLARRVARSQATPDDPGFAPLARAQSAFADWTPENLAPHEESIESYSNCDEVEFFINGRSLGSQPQHRDASPRTWTLPFEAGTIRAVCKNKGGMAAWEELRRASKPARIVLSVDRPRLSNEWDDIAYATAKVVDDKGVVVPSASDEIEFKIAGPGVIAAVDNADNASHEPFHSTSRRAYQGTCIAIVRANGKGRVTVNALATGLTAGSATLDAR